MNLNQKAIEIKILVYIAVWKHHVNSLISEPQNKEAEISISKLGSSSVLIIRLETYKELNINCKRTRKLLIDIKTCTSGHILTCYCSHDILAQSAATWQLFLAYSQKTIFILKFYVIEFCKKQCLYVDQRHKLNFKFSFHKNEVHQNLERSQKKYYDCII